MANSKPSRSSSRSAGAKRQKVFIGVLIALGVVGGSVAWARSRRVRTNPFDLPPSEPKTDTKKPQLPAVKKSSGWVKESPPYHRGMVGPNIKRLQLAILSRDRQALPKSGADGYFGAETEAALVRLELPTVLDQGTFDRLVRGAGASAGGDPTAARRAKSLWSAITGGNFPAGLQVLRAVRSPQEFAALDRELKSLPRNPNALDTARFFLSPASPLSTAERSQVTAELKRIGLLHDPARGTWALPVGLSGINFI